MDTDPSKEWTTTLWVYLPEFKDVFYEKAQQIIAAKGDQLVYSDFNTIDVVHPGLHDGVKGFFDEFPIPRGSKVLEVGSGLGCSARFVHANYGHQIHGVEYLEHFAECSVFVNQALGYQDQIRIERGDIVQVALPEQTYDAAMSTATFLYIADPNGLRNTARALKSGAYFFFEDYFYVKPRDQWDANDMAIIQSRSMLSARTQEEACKILEDSGMEIIRVDECGRYWSEHAWRRAQEIFDEGIEKNTGPSSRFNQFAVVSPQFKCDLDHLSIEEIHRRYPDVAKQFDIEEMIFRNPRLTTGLRIISRKR